MEIKPTRDRQEERGDTGQQGEDQRNNGIVAAARGLILLIGH